MRDKLLPCLHCGALPEETTFESWKYYCPNKHCVIYRIAMEAPVWNRRYVCDDKNGKPVYAGDKVRGHVRLCNRNDKDPEYDEGVITFDKRGLIWRLKTGRFQKSIIANYDEIELIESEADNDS